ncbi:hypothetical protein ALO85_200143 [Pseudomonas syringae pv. aptata]|nr:hypothetical protein ALO85_200143 [Pseudomonas syringae pv. aptata]
MIDSVRMRSQLQLIFTCDVMASIFYGLRLSTLYAPQDDVECLSP